MIPMGCDFAFTNAQMYFWSMDNMIKYINDNYYYNTTIFYSTPNTYLNAIKASNITFPTRYHDMFPYADYQDDFWTGYFSSRPNSKKQVRDGQASLHAASKVFSLSAIFENATDVDIVHAVDTKEMMLDSMGVYQHHDAVTGTARQHVANDYIYNLYNSMKINN
jgi:hypothetical protein